ncbi:MAG: hypothetical protein ACD_79C01379G0003 [uncultured bacterium]|nr:MAG: hypothetical protein ACD_79C01379G0003 [uncultured bacterium]
MKIPFNKPFIVGKELFYISQAVLSGKLAGNGPFSKKCSDFLKQKFEFKEIFMTTSGTSALEMAALLCDLKPGDEVILPSFTFVSTANAFYIHGASLKFVDIDKKTLNMSIESVKAAITEKTKVIVPVHYAGVGCEMDEIMKLASEKNIIVVEDAAHAINSKFKNRNLGSFGHFSALSFHETKNFISGEGGALIINDEKYFERASIVWEKGTNRKAFYEGLVDKYTWVDVGSSFYPSELITSFLYGQFMEFEKIMNKRKSLWNYYWSNLIELQNQDKIRLPVIPSMCEHNAHMFYILTNTHDERSKLLNLFHENNIGAVFHFIPLHSSPMGKKMGYADGDFPCTEDISKRIIRLPLFHELENNEQDLVISVINNFFRR